jgi:hypothetical protein
LNCLSQVVNSDYRRSNPSFPHAESPMVPLDLPMNTFAQIALALPPNLGRRHEMVQQVDNDTVLYNFLRHSPTFLMAQIAGCQAFTPQPHSTCNSHVIFIAFHSDLSLSLRSWLPRSFSLLSLVNTAPTIVYRTLVKLNLHSDFICSD